ncbi:CRISPR-associated endonuclease Cas1 [Arthrospira sp. PCC 9108]|nr:CRISPR-associated endonuclease Cas1 [Arthrospira sp. PCC 9108]
MTAIYLTEPQSYLEADLRDFAIVYNDRIQSRHSIDTTQQIIAFEGCTLGRSAIAAIYRYRIRLSFIGDNGHITAQITPRKHPSIQSYNRSAIAIATSASLSFIHFYRDGGTTRLKFYKA